MSEIKNKLVSLESIGVDSSNSHIVIALRHDLYSAFHIEVGRAYLKWFSKEDSIAYLTKNQISKEIITRVLESNFYRGSCDISTDISSIYRPFSNSTVDSRGN